MNLTFPQPVQLQPIPSTQTSVTIGDGHIDWASGVMTCPVKGNAIGGIAVQLQPATIAAIKADLAAALGTQTGQVPTTSVPAVGP